MAIRVCCLCKAILCSAFYAVAVLFLEISIGIWDMCYKEVQKGLIITAADIKDYCTLRDLSKLPRKLSLIKQPI